MSQATLEDSGFDAQSSGSAFSTLLTTLEAPPLRLAEKNPNENSASQPPRHEGHNKAAICSYKSLTNKVASHLREKRNSASLSE